MVMAFYFLQMGHGIKEHLIIMIFMGGDFMYGLMKGNMKEIGLEIKCMGKGKLFGQMEGVMKENMKMIKSMGMVLLNGKMEGTIQGNGKTGNNMGEECILIKRERKEKGNGMMGKGLNGWMKDRMKKINNFLIKLREISKINNKHVYIKFNIFYFILRLIIS